MKNICIHPCLSVCNVSRQACVVHVLTRAEHLNERNVEPIDAPARERHRCRSRRGGGMIDARAGAEHVDPLVAVGGPVGRAQHDPVLLVGLAHHRLHHRRGAPHGGGGDVGPVRGLDHQRAGVVLLIRFDWVRLDEVRLD